MKSTLVKPIICPSCGSDSINRTEENRFAVSIPYDFNYKKINFICNVCNEEGDFSGECDENYRNAEIEYIRNVEEKISYRISGFLFSTSLLRNIVDTNNEDFKRWKNGNFHESELSLLRIISLYPEILKIE